MTSTETKIIPPAENPRPARAAPATSRAWMRALELTAPIGKHPERTFPAVIGELAARFGDAPALIAETGTLSFRALNARANAYARWAIRQGLRRGETVCLMMPNRPEYMAAWLGITRAGGVAALLNTHLTGASLAHCMDIVDPMHIVVAADLIDSVRAAQPHLSTKARIWSHGAAGTGFPEIAAEVDALPDHDLGADEYTPVTIDDRALYVYTSGTTGLPKAAKISHYRLMVWTHWFAGLMETTVDDRMYNCLPMYHSVGGAVATGAVLVNGGSVVIRDRFSASRFWDDVARFECTLFQYIGELCRYLLNAPPHPRETSHRLRMCCGNGLRPDIWEAFKERFAIPRILEFYAATEANISLFNVEGKPGAIGRIPAFLAHRSGVALVRFDTERNAPIRDENGFCLKAGINEAGEAIGKIAENAERGARFDGYTNREATENKILRDVFQPGDAWFRTGDLMRRDETGFYYFVDRIGDTFRWKGENVATSEVAAAITGFPGVLDANVYGVALPGTDGRAGAAELVSPGGIDVAAFADHLLGELPAYAIPVLLRVRSEIEVTPTFKQKKSGWTLGHFDPQTCKDLLYVLEPRSGVYMRLDSGFYDRICAGAIRF